MKKCFKFLSLLLLLTAITLTFACGEDKKEVTIENVYIASETIPSSILTTEVLDKIDDIKIKIEKSDDSVEVVNVDKAMISSSDLDKLNTEE